MNIQLNEHWTLEESYDEVKGRIQKRLFRCGNLINYLRPLVNSHYSEDSTRYQEYLLYVRTLSNIKDKLVNGKDIDLNLIENRLDILESRLIDIQLVTSEILNRDDLFIKTIPTTVDVLGFDPESILPLLKRRLTRLLTPTNWTEDNPFIIDGETRPPFINRIDLLKKLEDFSRMDLTDIPTMEKVILLTEYLTGKLSSHIDDRFNLRANGEHDVTYFIHINHKSISSKILNRYKNNYAMMKELLSIVYWDDFSYYISPTGDIKFTFVKDNNWERSRPLTTQSIMSSIIRAQLK